MKETKNPELSGTGESKQSATKQGGFQPFATMPMKNKSTAKASAPKASEPPVAEFKTAPAPAQPKPVERPAVPKSAPVKPAAPRPVPREPVSDYQAAPKASSPQAASRASTRSVPEFTPPVPTQPMPTQSAQGGGKRNKMRKIALLICAGIATLISFLLIFVPFYSKTEYGESVARTPANALGGAFNSIPLSIASIVVFLASFAALLLFVPTVVAFFKNERKFMERSQKHMYFTLVLPLVFFVVGYVLAFIESSTTLSFIPLIFSAIDYVAYWIIKGQMNYASEEKAKKAKKKFKFEPLIYLSLMTAFTFLLLALNVIRIKISYGSSFSHDVSLNGYQLLSDSHKLEGGFQVLAFVVLAVFVSSGVLFMLSLAGFFAKSDICYKLIRTSLFVNFICVMAISLFSLYFTIAQKVNEETLLSLLAQYNITLGQNEIISQVSNQAVYAFAAQTVVLVVAVIRGQFNQAAVPAVASVAASEESGEREEGELPASAEEKSEATGDFDACPAFSELDGKVRQFNAEIANRQQQPFAAPTLSGIVSFVVDYARESRLHLSYSLEDIATFVAGLGASRLAILQGMSGTGKTSLPKIFTEAIMGTCEIVEVESSWRDKNELLGYYNEFSKCFTPKKFTQCLYKASLNPTVPTFIVLDEMNLSRIEYYFSDFLSLMEHEEDKREIKLLNVKLWNTVNGKKIPYRALSEGHTLKVPNNVWFIGTANRDESTFEISDKVYDRAQTMDFNKRAPKIRSFRAPIAQRFVPSDTLTALFEQAKNGVRFEAEDNPVVRAVEKLLAPYNISFGNRILKQMEEFVKIYCACFDSVSDEIVKDAVDRILLSKVVRKLETKIVTDKKSLVTELNNLRLPRCSEFAQKLNED